jgi:hypothetical protein
VPQARLDLQLPVPTVLPEQQGPRPQEQERQARRVRRVRQVRRVLRDADQNCPMMK